MWSTRPRLTDSRVLLVRPARVGQRVRGEAPAVAQHQTSPAQLHAQHGARRAQLRDATSARRCAGYLVHVHDVRILEQNVLVLLTFNRQGLIYTSNLIVSSAHLNVIFIVVLRTRESLKCKDVTAEKGLTYILYLVLP
jgi:hypothetical protein